MWGRTLKGLSNLGGTGRRRVGGVGALGSKSPINACYRGWRTESVSYGIIGACLRVALSGKAPSAFEPRKLHSD